MIVLLATYNRSSYDKEQDLLLPWRANLLPHSLRGRLVHVTASPTHCLFNSCSRLPHPVRHPLYDATQGRRSGRLGSLACLVLSRRFFTTVPACFVVVADAGDFRASSAFNFFFFARTALMFTSRGALQMHPIYARETLDKSASMQVCRASLWLPVESEEEPQLSAVMKRTCASDGVSVSATPPSHCNCP